MALRVRKGNSELFNPVITIFTLLHQDIFKYIKMILPFSCVRVHCMHKNSVYKNKVVGKGIIISEICYNRLNVFTRCMVFVLLYGVLYPIKIK